MTRRPTYSPMVRAAAGLVAAAAWSAEALFVAAPLADGVPPLRILWRTSAFLTDWSNLFVAAVCTMVAFGFAPLASARWTLRAAVAILTVGLLFAGIGGLNVVISQGASSVLAHVVTPLAMSLLWLLALRDGAGSWRDLPGVLVFPLVYLAQMFARGALGDGYPYPEVDVTRVGWGGATAFAGLVLVIYVLVGTILVAIDRRRYSGR